jgi:phosphatidylserine/phosphatidylglycerophosphate/cardiolipin synthase-like enzyme
MAREGIRTKFDLREALNVLDWLETANKLLLRPQDSLVYFSPGQECRCVIVDQLKRTLTSVDICVYTISDDVISEEILDCRRRNVKVRIISDDEKVDDAGSDVYQLAASGIETRVDNCPHYMHHKFAVFDNRRVLTGSYNWTRGAAERNQENILLTDDKQTVAAFKDEFEKLWTQFKPL